MKANDYQRNNNFWAIVVLAMNLLSALFVALPVLHVVHDCGDGVTADGLVPDWRQGSNRGDFCRAHDPDYGPAPALEV